MANVRVQVLLLGIRYAIASGASYSAGLSLSQKLSRKDGPF